MPDIDLRPLSLGEMLDRTFSLYRRHFLLFVGITALPNLLILAFGLTEAMMLKTPVANTARVAGRVQAPPASGLIALGVVGIFVAVIVYVVAYLFAQGGTVYAVSEIYLGRTTSIRASLGRMRGQLGSLLGVSILSGLAAMAGFILLVIPGIYVICRLITAVPAALLEDLGPRAALERSFKLTEDNAGKAFVIYLLYFVLQYAATLLFVFPFTIATALSAKSPAMMQTWFALSQVGSFVATVLVGPVFTISAAVFYYDLRVRKEAFDLQVMMNSSGIPSPGFAGVPTVLS
jgi:hypothetical protein